MLRMIGSTSSVQAKAYFAEALAKSDYYVSDAELQGRFEGKISERLGITGAATKEIFNALADNINPQTGEHLTPITRDARRVGCDLSFHPAKSVSIVHALSGDDHILKAIESSVHETMLAIERDAKTRVRREGKDEDRETGELVWASFTHQTARGSQGRTPDPHLHVHNYIFNASYDAVEGRYKAGQFGDIMRDLPYYQSLFHKLLSNNLIELGYQIRRTEKSFEIEGVPEAVIDLFSKRTNHIGQVAKELGITDEKELSELGARTRDKKQKGLTMAELKADWLRQIRDLGPVGEGGNKDLRFAPLKAVAALSPEQCVEHALSHGFERASVLQDRRLLASAFRHGIGHASVSPQSITDTFKSDSRIIHVKERSRVLCTTKAVLAQERRMVELARQGQGRLLPLYRQFPKIRDSKLGEQQRAAISHILTSPHQVFIVRGAAGSGKTTMLKELDHHLREAGKFMTVVSPTADSSRGVLREEGFSEADTIARLLVDETMQEKIKDHVLCVDEAGLLGTMQMTQLLELSLRQNARLVLVGDTRQNSSVERGDALRILNTVAKIPVAEVSTIFRQRHAQYREAVQKLADGDVRSAFTQLDDLGMIREVDPLQPNAELVDDYLKTVMAGKSALVVSPTHAQGDAVTKAIRDRLKEEGLLGKKELDALRLTSTNATAAEKTDWRNYHVGQVVRITQNAPGLKRGSAWTVASATPDGVEVVNAQGDIRDKLPIDGKVPFEIYEQSRIGLCRGDKVRITRGSFDEKGKRLNNGQQMEIHSITESGAIELRGADGKTTYHLDSAFGDIAHAYCTTSHASQGKTVDEVLISQPSATFPATDAKQFYVSVSRGKERCRIYTDDKEQLLEHAAKIGDRQSALELVRLSADPGIAIAQHQIDHYAHLEHERAARAKVELVPQPSSERDYVPGI